jgi:hypothetical protein
VSRDPEATGSTEKESMTTAAMRSLTLLTEGDERQLKIEGSRDARDACDAVIVVSFNPLGMTRLAHRSGNARLRRPSVDDKHPSRQGDCNTKAIVNNVFRKKWGIRKEQPARKEGVLSEEEREAGTRSDADAWVTSLVSALRLFLLSLTVLSW